MLKNVVYSAAGVLCVSLICLTLLVALGRDVPPVLVAIVGGLGIVVQSALPGIVSKSKEEKSE